MSKGINTVGNLFFSFLGDAMDPAGLFYFKRTVNHVMKLNKNQDSENSSHVKIEIKCNVEF
jgi:hypothetical protein